MIINRLFCNYFILLLYLQGFLEKLEIGPVALEWALVKAKPLQLQMPPGVDWMALEKILRSLSIHEILKAVQEPSAFFASLSTLTVEEAKEEAKECLRPPHHGERES